MAHRPWGARLKRQGLAREALRALAQACAPPARWPWVAKELALAWELGQALVRTWGALPPA